MCVIVSMSPLCDCASAAVPRCRLLVRWSVWVALGMSTRKLQIRVGVRCCLGGSSTRPPPDSRLILACRYERRRYSSTGVPGAGPARHLHVIHPDKYRHSRLRTSHPVHCTCLLPSVCTHLHSLCSCICIWFYSQLDWLAAAFL